MSNPTASTDCPFNSTLQNIFLLRELSELEIAICTDCDFDGIEYKFFFVLGIVEK